MPSAPRSAGINLHAVEAQRAAARDNMHFGVAMAEALELMHRERLRVACLRVATDREREQACTTPLGDVDRLAHREGDRRFHGRPP